MKKIVLLMLILISSLFGNTSKIDKLEEKVSVIKASYSNVNDNSEKTETILLEAKYNSDITMLNKSINISPYSNIKYEDRETRSYTKYDCGILLEHTYPETNYGIYGKISIKKDEYSKIDNNSKYGLGLYQYIYKSKSGIIKTREGLQLSTTKYTDDVKERENIKYVKLGIIAGKYFTDTIFFRTKLDYDISTSNNNKILVVNNTLDIPITSRLDIELNHKYEYDNVTVPGTQNKQTIYNTYLVYRF